MFLEETFEQKEIKQGFYYQIKDKQVQKFIFIYYGKFVRKKFNYFCCCIKKIK